jgi:hypothetical protein
VILSPVSKAVACQFGKRPLLDVLCLMSAIAPLWPVAQMRKSLGRSGTTLIHAAIKTMIRPIIERVMPEGRDSASAIVHRQVAVRSAACKKPATASPRIKLRQLPVSTGGCEWLLRTGAKMAARHIWYQAPSKYGRRSRPVVAMTLFGKRGNLDVLSELTLCLPFP